MPIQRKSRDNAVVNDGGNGLVSGDADLPKESHVARESEERLRTLVDNIPQLAWMANADGWIFWYNKRWYEYTGTTPAQMEGWGWQSVHDPQELPRVLAGWKASIATGQPFEMTFPLRSAEGEFRWFLTRVFPLKDEAGRVQRWFGTNTDVHEIRELEERLRKSEERLRVAQDAAGIGTWELDWDDNFQFSPQAYSVLGMAPSPGPITVADVLNQLYLSSDRENLKAALQASRRKKRELHVDFRIRGTSGDDPRWISARGSFFYNSGQPLIVGVFVDVTLSRKEAEQSRAQLAGLRQRKPRAG